MDRFTNFYLQVVAGVDVELVSLSIPAQLRIRALAYTMHVTRIEPTLPVASKVSVWPLSFMIILAVPLWSNPMR